MNIITLREATEQFLACQRMAVTGVSRKPTNQGSVVAGRLLAHSHQVFAINPNTPEINGIPCYPTLAAIPGGVEAVVIATQPKHALATRQEAIALGIDKVWMHRAFDQGSVSAEASRYDRMRLGSLTVAVHSCLANPQMEVTE